MRKVLICALALGGFAASAHAADLSVDSMKDPLPDTLAYAGVTFYGTIDVGYGYQSHGAPSSDAFYVGSDWTSYGSKFANAPQQGFTNNALSQSTLGVKLEEAVGMGFVAIGKLDTGIDPAFGTIADACKSLIENNGKPTGPGMTVNGDGSRCGQFINGEAYAGLSNASYGTLKVGRQNSLVNDGMGAYDAIAGSYAFSLISYSGTPGPGIGSTETARWDNSIKYIYQYGPAHVAGMYTSGGQDTPIIEGGYGGNAGFTWKGFSVDGYYTKENGAVNLSTIGYTSGAVFSGAGSKCDASIGGCPNALNGTVYNDEAFDIMAKYTMEFGGGFKDEGPSSKLTFYGGYQHVDQTNPDHVQSYYNGMDTEGGYQFFTSTSATAQALGGTKTLETEWAGAKYEMGPWTFAGAYYHWSQDAYVAAGGAVCSTNGSGIKSSNCAGDVNQGSFVVDYAFNKHFDVYAGLT
ncbi:MAG: porin, partial [Rhodomicrobium sp.]